MYSDNSTCFVEDFSDSFEGGVDLGELEDEGVERLECDVGLLRPLRHGLHHLLFDLRQLLPLIPAVYQPHYDSDYTYAFFFFFFKSALSIRSSVC